MNDIQHRARGYLRNMLLQLEHTDTMSENVAKAFSTALMASYAESLVDGDRADWIGIMAFQIRRVKGYRFEDFFISSELTSVQPIWVRVHEQVEVESPAPQTCQADLVDQVAHVLARTMSRHEVEDTVPTALIAIPTHLLTRVADLDRPSSCKTHQSTTLIEFFDDDGRFIRMSLRYDGFLNAWPQYLKTQLSLLS